MLIYRMKNGRTIQEIIPIFIAIQWNECSKTDTHRFLYPIYMRLVYLTIPRYTIRV